MHHAKPLSRAMIGALVALLVLTSSALAQSGSNTISLTVLTPDPCKPVDGGPMEAAVAVGAAPITVPGGTSASDTGNLASTSFEVDVINAGCKQWSVTASLTDFALTGAPGTMFPGATFVLTKNTDRSINPFYPPSNLLPVWMQNGNIPPNTGNPSMPGQVTFTEKAGGGSATSDVSLISPSTAWANGSPGTWYAYYWMSLAGVPTDAVAGDYTSTITVSANSGD